MWSLSVTYTRFSTAESDGSDGEYVDTSEPEELERVDAPLARSTRKKKGRPPYVAYTEDLLSKLMPMLQQRTPAAEVIRTEADPAVATALSAIQQHMQAEAAKRDKEAEAKKRRREEELPEQEQTLQKWGEIELQDDGAAQINQQLRAKLRGPTGDPAVWFTGEFTKEKVEPVVGAGIHLRHLMGSDRINPKTLRLHHSKYSILDLKHFATANSGVTRELDQDFAVAKDGESGEQLLSTRVRWAEINTMFDAVDSALNQVIATRAIRPWDYGPLAMYRAMHRARMFQEPAKTEKKQLEMVKVNYTTLPGLSQFPNSL